MSLLYTPVLTPVNLNLSALWWWYEENYLLKLVLIEWAHHFAMPSRVREEIKGENAGHPKPTLAKYCGNGVSGHSKILFTPFIIPLFILFSILRTASSSSLSKSLFSLALYFWFCLQSLRWQYHQPLGSSSFWKVFFQSLECMYLAYRDSKRV